MERVAIMGFGLMGASLGLALRRSGFSGTIRGYARRAETRESALSRGMADEVFDQPGPAVAGADLVVFCTPILTIPDLVRQCRADLREGCLLTDVGSTKSKLMQEIAGILDNDPVTFIGSHPVAGSEQQGLEAACEDLYEGALVIVTPAGTSGATERVTAFWERLGSHTLVMDAEAHDRLMARTSHLPHMVAVLLALTAGREGAPEQTGAFCGTGFRDTSRIAEGSPEVWHDIVSTNAPLLIEELRAYEHVLHDLLNRMELKDFDGVKEVLEKGRQARRDLMRHSPAQPRDS